MSLQTRMHVVSAASVHSYEAILLTNWLLLLAKQFLRIVVCTMRIALCVSNICSVNPLAKPEFTFTSHVAY